MERSYFGSKFISGEMLTTIAPLLTYILVATGFVSNSDQIGELVLQVVSGVVALGTIISLHLTRAEIKKTVIQESEG